MSAPCIKGTAFDSVLQDVRGLLEDGRLTRGVLGVRLSAEDLALLDAKIAPSSWYPIGCYAWLLEALCDAEAAGQPEAYLFRRGTIAAERLHAAGIYPQLDASGEKLGLRVLPLVISIAGSIYNFMHWQVEIDPAGDAFQVSLDGATAYPNVARFAAEGFLACTTERIIGRKVEVWSERPAPDRVIFHASAPRNASRAQRGDAERMRMH